MSALTQSSAGQQEDGVIKKFFNNVKMDLQEFLVQNDPMLAYVVKGEPKCYADQV